MSTAQPGILQSVPVVARYVTFSITQESDRPAVGEALQHRGDLLHLTRRLEKTMAPALRLRDVVDAFRHALGESGHGKDLTGYEDGTENPKGPGAEEAALVRGQGAGMDGSSYLAVQQWVHDLDAFEVQMRRMAGYEDDVLDAMFRISRPVTGSYFWCPPVREGQLDLRQLGL